MSVTEAPATAGAPPYIQVNDLDVTYGTASEAVTALSAISLSVAQGEFVSLVGPSGCGKSTLLKTIGDLLTPTRGDVMIDGVAASDLRRKGRIGVVFQQASLMPWLTIADNVSLLRRLVDSRQGPAVAPVQIDELLRTVGLEGFDCRYPNQLSGGMQQRAALARALAIDPAILLMDEPFAALDEITRDRMGFELLRIWAHYRKTVVFVTHSLAEAVFLSDRVVLMTPRPGRIHRIAEIDLPRPRTRELRLTDKFMHLVGSLNRDLYQLMA